ncbi:4a-hydroxytetrahydrobiopterin dehydratase [Celerinatantimonas sp. MCCC 1A17872]|uniref:4a-hydroxytetrahydrobiopterin dehydratase n=1 Tax=Celerinatantimonas sp. MCCC 1A17872 TaxID=3177514 RepID=UPI0038C733E1
MAKNEQTQANALDQSQISQLLSHLDHWQLQHTDSGYHLVKKYRCAQFADSMLLANQIANMAQLENHHPRLTIQSQWVQVCWWSESCQGLTEMDFIMAARCDELAERNVG